MCHKIFLVFRLCTRISLFANHEIYKTIGEELCIKCWKTVPGSGFCFGWSLFYYDSLLIIVVGLPCTSPSPRLNFNDVESIDKVENLIQYEYQYAVDESLRKGPVMDRWERRLGEYVKGGYSVLDPDGSVRTVDYEVDGLKGYHAVIRFNPPSRSLLSSLQLAQSNELFPEASPANADEPHHHIESSRPAALPLQGEVPPSPNGSLLPHNYHARAPYINKFGYKDFKAAASTNIAVASSQYQLPPSPANYNAGNKRSPIFYKTPAGSILPGAVPPSNTFNLDALLPHYGEPLSSAAPSRHTQAIPRPAKPIKRHSKLVKRYDSIRQALY